MKLLLNGEAKEFPSTLTVQELLNHLSIPPGRVACEVNMKIIRRPRYEGTLLKEGDVVEIIQAIGGG